MKSKKYSKKVSIILAIYNADRTIQECLDAVIAQDFPKKDYEIIIVDGGSNDKTLPIIKEFIKQNKDVQIKLMNNPYKLSEGVGMGKDQGVAISKGEFILFLDHDNIIFGKDWMNKMLFPFKDNKEVMASQSFLNFRENDQNFLKYVNAAGVEDAFAIPYSLVAQITVHPERFRLIKDKYYFYTPRVH